MEQQLHSAAGAPRRDTRDNASHDTEQNLDRNIEHRDKSTGTNKDQHRGNQ